jgi:polyadenylate-binding protein
MRQAEVNRILGKVDELAVSDEEMDIPYVVGESVKVVDGPFNNFNGVIENINEEKLQREFVKYGKIINVKIVKDNTSGKSRGFGFVRYDKVEEAVKAVSEMNGKILKEKELFVVVHQPKERQRLNQNYNQYKKKFSQNRNLGGRNNFISNRSAYIQSNSFISPSPYSTHIYRNAPQRHHLIIPSRSPNLFQTNVSADFTRQSGFSSRPITLRMTQRPININGRTQIIQKQPISQKTVLTNISSSQRQQNNDNPLTIQQLSQVDSKQQKQLIGERIFPQVQAIEPKLAGKITGMLLEMDNTELLHLLENKSTLMEKVNEALLILQQSARQAGAQ